MKLKKKVKRVLIAILIILAIAAIGIGIFLMTKKEEVQTAKVISTINDYGYTLKDNKSKRYQKLFEELDEILKKESVEEEEYVKKIAEMFILDFYTLNDKTAKTDVGGVDFVYSTIVDNFLENAENTFYRYVESNIYNDRKQKLPTVDEITIESVEKTTYEYEDTTDEEAYQVVVNWTYTDQEFEDYQTTATLIFVHEDKKLSLVELK